MTRWLAAMDYLITKRSELGVTVMETPYVAAVEAKRDFSSS